MVKKGQFWAVTNVVKNGQFWVVISVVKKLQFRELLLWLKRGSLGGY